jgi:hypothetical protein
MISQRRWGEYDKPHLFRRRGEWVCKRDSHVYMAKTMRSAYEKYVYFYVEGRTYA